MEVPLEVRTETTADHSDPHLLVGLGGHGFRHRQSRHRGRGALKKLPAADFRNASHLHLSPVSDLNFPAEVRASSLPYRASTSGRCRSCKGRWEEMGRIGHTWCGGL